MPNYIRLIGEHLYNPPIEAYVAPGGDPTVYGDIVWISTPIAQVTLDALDQSESGLESEVTAQLATLSTGDVLQWDGGAWVPVPPPPTDGGALEFEYAEDDTPTDTTSQVYVEKIKMTFTAVASDYLIEWTSEVKSTHSSTKIAVRCQVDDTTIVNEQETNPDHIAGTGFGTAAGYKRLALTAGSHDIDIDFKSTRPNRSVCIQACRIKVTRVI